MRFIRTTACARPDYDAEVEKDRPRQEAEMKEMQAKAEEEKKQQAINGDKEVADYLKKNNITAQKAPGGTYVVVEKKGDGEPVVSGKFLAIKYTGRSMQTGNEFESNVYKFQVGTRNVIEGWDDGLLLFNKGGKGVLYIPGYLAYGAQQGPGGTTWESLIFDVEVLAVGNTQEEVDSVNTPQ